MNEFKCPIDFLMYRSYEWNRRFKPDLDPKVFRKYYPDAELYEKIYEKNNQNNGE